MHMLIVALLASAAWSDAAVVEPSEDAMREAFAADLSESVRNALTFVTETEGAQALERIREARTDEFEIRTFHKGACRPSSGEPGHSCSFVVELDTVSGLFQRSMVGRFFVGPCGLVFDNLHGADEG